jgi:hypothetical protein
MLIPRKTNHLSQPEDLDHRSIATSPNYVVRHDLAVLDYESENYNPYDTAPQLSDRKIETNFGRRLPRPNKQTQAVVRKISRV